MLSIARALARLPKSERPKRSILFASVAAEEQGLLGSEFLARNPPIPAGRLAAVINIDGINILGPTEDVVVSNTEYWMGPDVTIAQATQSRVRAFGRVWDFVGRSAEICQIDWKGP